MRNHVKAQHPALFTEPYHREDYADVRSVDGTAVRTGVVHRPVVEKHEWEVDDIVLPVLKTLAAPAIAIDKLPAVFAWRDATAKMLEAVQ
jgi:hypothetical protein